MYFINKKNILKNNCYHNLNQLLNFKKSFLPSMCMIPQNSSFKKPFFKYTDQMNTASHFIFKVLVVVF